MEAELTLDVGQATHPGGRPANQDSLGCHVPAHLPERARGALFTVADGLGPGGAWASQMAVRGLLAQYYRQPARWAEQSLRRATARVNAQLYARVQTDPAARGTATTLVAAAIRGNRLYVAHVGDSRAYLVRGAQVHLLTADHTWVGEALARRAIEPQQAQHHPWRHALTRSLGSRPEVTVDVSRYTLQAGDTLVLCTGAINDRVWAPELVRLRAAGRPQHVAAALVELALQRSAGDNASALVVGVGEPRASLRRAGAAASRAAAVLAFWLGILSGAAASALLIVVLIGLLTSLGG